MPNILNIQKYSFNVKVAVSLFLLALFLITILSALIVPKMQKDQYNRTIKEIEQVLSLTQEQVKIAGKAIVVQSKMEIESNKNFLELQLAKIKENIDPTITIKELTKIIKDSPINNFSSYAIKSDNSIFINAPEDIYNKLKAQKYNTWEEYNTKIVSKDYIHTEKYFFYRKRILNDLEITIFATENSLNPKHFPFEESLKINIQNTFNITQDLHKGKTYIFWLNSKYKNEDNIPLYNEDKSKSEQKYTLSKMSSVSNIYTGDLSAKQIMNVGNKNFIEHTLNGKKAISWIINVYEKEYEGYIFLLVKTIYKEELIKHLDSAFLKILPAALISLLLALLIGFFIFKRLFRSINILTNTAKEVNNGNKRIRSNVKGNDDIGYLGIAFDSMLDSFENNIRNLDLKVEEKTKKLQSSLEEKDILLKEIHHRVKNNLALTISLIKLQQEEVEGEKAEKTLIDIQERIYTMELLHRKLYESTHLNKINFKEYIINLLNNISITYMYENSIKKTIEIKDIYLNIEKAMPCGLILNEIITNAFKYAFKNNTNPKLIIRMKRENNTYVLMIKDNGEGIDKNIDISNSNTLGLKLIHSISTLQLKGKIEYSYENGALFKITF